MKSACLLFLATAASAFGQIHADVKTSMGDFSIELDHAAAPRTVANFIGLAEGTRSWVDSVSGAVRTGAPYYDGITFHRVIAGFMSQTGSKKGDGTDGPGYAFQDEFAGGLTHSGPYVVSMANSGPNTNGSQFFITAAATPHLDGKHTVFGLVSTGRTVVDAINAVPTTSDKPDTPVVIQSIRIRRVGAAAEAFDEHAHLLPTVTRPDGILRVVPGGQVTWHCPSPLTPGTTFRATRSTALAGPASWEEPEGAFAVLGLGDAPRGDFPLGDSENARAFYHLSCAHHPDAGGISSLVERVITVEVPSLDGELRFVFDATGGGGALQFVPEVGTPVAGTFTALSPSLGHYHTGFIANTSLFLGGTAFIPWIKCGWSQTGESAVTGRHDSTRYVGGNWIAFDRGDASLDR